MADPYLGEIRILACTYAPDGWALCDGSPVGIDDNPTLYQLIGTTYGGDGQSVFNLPDLRGRLPLHAGGIWIQGQNAGSEQVQLQTGQLPAHNHLLTVAASPGAQASAAGCVLAQSQGPLLYAEVPGQPGTALSGQSVGVSGSGTPHDNMMPFLTLNFCIALKGNYPPRN